MSITILREPQLKIIITNLANYLHILDIILSKPTIQLIKRGIYVQYKVRYTFAVFYKNVEQNIRFSFLFEKIIAI